MINYNKYVCNEIENAHFKTEFSYRFLRNICITKSVIESFMILLIEFTHIYTNRTQYTACK